MMSSCDDALATYNVAEMKVESAYAVMVAWAIEVGVSIVALAAAIIIGIAFLALLGTPAGVVTVAAMGVIVAIGVLAVIALAVGVGSLWFAFTAWLDAQEKRDQAYAEVWNKCQNEPDRIPTFDAT
jgi:hypothetical protein